jgi:hypothetical protein
MEFSNDRKKAAALVTLVFLLGIAFGVVGMLTGRRVFGAVRAGAAPVAGDAQIQQLLTTLNLSADQRRQFNDILTDTRAHYRMIREAMEPQFAEVRDQNRERIRQILTEGQRPQFEQFQRESKARRDQAAAARRDAPPGARSGGDSGSQMVRLTQRLDLSAAQQTQLSAILRETRASFDALRQQMDPQFEQVRLQNRERLRTIVAPEQRPVLETFFQMRDEERRRK